MKNAIDQISKFCNKTGVRVVFDSGKLPHVSWPPKPGMESDQFLLPGVLAAILEKEVGPALGSEPRWVQVGPAPAPGYEPLADVLQRAFDQSASGKGKERHAGDGVPFLQQPIMQIARRRGTGFLLGQADKKSEEAMGLPPGRDVAEILGAIVYLCAAVIHLEEQRAANG